MTTPAQRIGSDLHCLNIPAHACGNLEELRGWLTAANVEYLTSQAATLADHRRLVEQVKAAVREAQRG